MRKARRRKTKSKVRSGSLNDRLAKRKASLQKRMKRGQEKTARKGTGFLKPIEQLPEGFKEWNPGVGEHLIDILCYEAGANDPLVDEGEDTYGLMIGVHMRVGPDQKPFVCLGEFDESCPVCEARNDLREAGEHKDVWVPLFPSDRTLYNVSVLDNTDEYKKGVQVWQVANFYMEKHLQKLSQRVVRPGMSKTVDPYIYFSDPSAKEGRSIAFEIEQAKSKDSYKSYIGHRFELREEDIPARIINGVYQLDQLIYIPEYDEVKELFDKGKHTERVKDKEVESGVSEETELFDEYSKMSKRDLITEARNLGVKITPKMRKNKALLMDAVVAEALEVNRDMEEEAEEIKARACPHGHAFGEDAGEHEECDECPYDLWEKCSGEE